MMRVSYLSSALAYSTRTFVVPPSQQQTLIELVTKLDGLPLAIYLAAGRIGMFDISTILHEIKNGFGMLRSAHRDGQPRQATLNQAIAWSWELMTAKEQEILIATTVFSGGFDADAAKAVLAGHSDSSSKVMVILENLINKSMLRIDKISHPVPKHRFFHYESIRTFATEKRIDDDSWRALKLAHARYYVERGETWAKAIDYDESGVAANHLVLEFENLWVANHRCIVHDIKLNARAALCLDVILDMRGPWPTRHDLLNGCLYNADRLPPPLRARVLLSAGRMWRLHDRAKSGGYYKQALVAAREIDGYEEEAYALLGMANLRLLDNRHHDSEVLLSKIVTLCEKHALEELSGRTALQFAQIRNALNRFRESESFCKQALEIFEKHGNYRWKTRAASFLGRSYQRGGRLRDAAAKLEHSIEVYRKLADREAEGISLGIRAIVAHEEADLARARQWYKEAIALTRPTGNMSMVAWQLLYLGLCEIQLDELEEARHALEESLAICKRLRFSGQLEGHGYHAVLEALDGRFQAARTRLTESQSLSEAKKTPYAKGLYLSFKLCLTVIERNMIKPLDSIEAEILERRIRTLSAARAPGFQLYEIRLLNALIETFARKGDCSALLGSSQQDTPSRPYLILHTNAEWFCLRGREQIDIKQHTAIRLLLKNLANRHLDNPGEPIPRQELIDIIWPGQSNENKSLTHRLHVNISKLRKLGLGNLLRYELRGYYLDPDLDIQRDDDAN